MKNIIRVMAVILALSAAACFPAFVQMEVMRGASALNHESVEVQNVSFYPSHMDTDLLGTWETIYTTENVTMNVTIMNNGSSTATDFIVNLTGSISNLDDWWGIEQNQTVASLDAGASAVVSFNFTPHIGGSGYFNASVDGGGFLWRGISVRSGPPSIFSYVVCELQERSGLNYSGGVAEVPKGSQVQLRANLSNVGYADATDINVTCLVNCTDPGSTESTVLLSQQVAAIPARSNITYNFTWDSSPALGNNYTIILFTNGTWQGQIQWLRIEYTALNISYFDIFGDRQILYGEYGRVWAGLTVLNTGTAALAEFQYTLEVDGAVNQTGTQSIQDVTPGTIMSYLNVSTHNLSLGEHTLRIIVGNLSAEANFTVTETPVSSTPSIREEVAETSIWLEKYNGTTADWAIVPPGTMINSTADYAIAANITNYYNTTVRNVTVAWHYHEVQNGTLGEQHIMDSGVLLNITAFATAFGWYGIAGYAFPQTSYDAEYVFGGLLVSAGGANINASHNHTAAAIIPGIPSSYPSGGNQTGNATAPAAQAKGFLPGFEAAAMIGAISAITLASAAYRKRKPE